jgi:uncharacterized protein (DUF1697 family)
MARYVALLRAVNVGGTGKLAMAELRTMCAEVGFRRVETYIASGNVVFDSDDDAAGAKAVLERVLARRLGRPVGVVIRGGQELADVLGANPFPTASPQRTVAIFLDDVPPADALATAKGLNDEELRLGRREIYVHYPSGIGRSKLLIPAAARGTARNMSTVAKLCEIAAR